MHSENKNPQIIGKAQLAEKLHISSSTLRRLLNIHYFEDLKKTGYNRYQKILYKHQLDIVFPFGIELEKE